MIGVLLSLHILISIVLIIVILIQQSQGEGLSGVFGGMGNTFFGGSGGTTFLIKVTIVLSVLFAVLTLSLVIFGSKKIYAGPESPAQNSSSGGGKIELQPYIGEYTDELIEEDTSGATTEDQEYYQSLLLTSDTIKDTFSTLENLEDTTGGITVPESSVAPESI